MIYQKHLHLPPIMPAEISSDLKMRIVKWYLHDDYSMEDIVDLAGVSLGLISKTISLYQQYGQVTNPLSLRTGRPKTLNEGDLRYLEEILRANPSLYLDELQLKLRLVRG
ncbi:hypothetical protein GGX14DRAFT_364817 [Mycena pura]|uniref:Paired domain-containing protein n=1 Tax=Mycena pura TaxID=153505 RepID=A0AAD6YEK4_9AGAR|nr:hypothetical protein GGX14DRAFT_364817 [Mycena pura]